MYARQWSGSTSRYNPKINKRGSGFDRSGNGPKLKASWGHRIHETYAVVFSGILSPVYTLDRLN